MTYGHPMLPPKPEPDDELPVADELGPRFELGEERRPVVFTLDNVIKASFFAVTLAAVIGFAMGAVWEKNQPSDLKAALDEQATVIRLLRLQLAATQERASEEFARESFNRCIRERSSECRNELPRLPLPVIEPPELAPRPFAPAPVPEGRLSFEDGRWIMRASDGGVIFTAWPPEPSDGWETGRGPE